MHRLDRRQRAAAPILGERVGAQGDITAGNHDPELVEHDILERRRAAGRQIGLHGSGADPAGNDPQGDQGDQARPPFAAPLEKTVHSISAQRDPQLHDSSPLLALRSTSRAAGAARGTSNLSTWKDREKTNPWRAVKPEISGP
jgi:hypothetical protein